MGGQKGGMPDEQGHFPAVCNNSFLVIRFIGISLEKQKTLVS
jgi:hypothetical protein